jgi:alpha-L-rhamnosidase
MRMILFFCIAVSIVLFSCTERDNKEKEDIFFKENSAQWIQDSRKLPEIDSLFYLEDPSPLFRKEFSVDKSIKNAKLYITSAGYYIATINEKRVGKNVLDPAWTDYTKKIYYSEYDVTSLIKNGENCLGVSLGNGFYNPLPLKMWGRINLREKMNVGKPSFISKLIITYNDGKSKEIVSDSSWKYAYGPIIKNSVYIGTYYDARKEIKKWSAPGFDDKSWKNVQVSDSPVESLKKPSSHPFK